MNSVCMATTMEVQLASDTARDGVDTRPKGEKDLTTSVEAVHVRGGQTAAAEPTHWLLRVGDGEHFVASQSRKIWGICSKDAWNKSFVRRVREGDVLWFIQSNTGGKVMGVATYSHHQARVLGPLIALTATNEELGWTKTHGAWDTEVHYTNLYDVSDVPQPILTGIKSPLVVRMYNPEKCAADLPSEYGSIVKYLRPN